MKVLLIKDVYKLGRAGEVKRVAGGYGRNYLIPQGLAMLATPGALRQTERILVKAEVHRTAQNEELKGLAEQINGLTLTFSTRAGETGKLYGSITTQAVAEAIQEKTHYEIRRQQVDMQPIRTLGEHNARIRLTIDLIPEVKVIIQREGEAEPSLLFEPEKEPKEAGVSTASELSAA
jgi:large subunit ribosomal protein L9